MSNQIKVIISVLLILGLYGCASPKMNLSAPADPNTNLNTEGKALVYFIRPITAGHIHHAAIYDGEKFVGFVPIQQKLPYVAEPGEHLFMIVSEAADFMKAELVAGKTYYAQVVPRMGMWRPRFSLVPITKAELGTEKVQKWIKESRLIKNNDMAYKWDIENRGSVLNRKAAYLEKWNLKKEEDKRFLKREDSE